MEPPPLCESRLRPVSTQLLKCISLYHNKSNVFIERLWRSIKYEDIYIQDYATMDVL